MTLSHRIGCRVAEAEHEEGTLDSSRSYDGVLPGSDNLPVATSGKSFPLACACAALSSPLHCHPFLTAEMSKRSATHLEREDLLPPPSNQQQDHDERELREAALKPKRRLQRPSKKEESDEESDDGTKPPQ